MVRMLCLSMVLVLALSVTGCAMVACPTYGLLYTEIKGPVLATDNTTELEGMKVGTAECSNILGLIAMGDASIETAAKSAGITKIYHVDSEVKNILGIFATYKLVVYGK